MATKRDEAAARRAIREAAAQRAIRADSRRTVSQYRKNGVRYVEFATAHDAYVCADCRALEAKNPYRLDDVPLPGQHPGCRCCLMPKF